MTDLVERLREQLTVRLIADQLDSAKHIRRMMVERAEAADEIEQLRKSLIEMQVAENQRLATS